jgi:hypothetical protein
MDLDAQGACTVLAERMESRGDESSAFYGSGQASQRIVEELSRAMGSPTPRFGQRAPDRLHPA